MKNRCLGCMAEKRSGEAVCPKCGYTDGTAPKEPLHIIPGTEIKNRYLIGTTLGFGGFGITYIAWDKTLKQKVAIKEYFPGDFATRMPGESRVTAFKGEMTQQYQAGLKRFMSEAQKLAKYGHVEGIVSIYDIFHENETAYIVMEYLEGQDVKSYLKDKGGKLTYDETMEIITPILKTLQIVHRDQLIHRDISPDNIFITKENKIKLLDFGAARYATTTHSKSLSVILKPGYAPEEQYRSKGIQGSWSDVYAVAATMYKMLTGMVPDEALERRVNDQLVEPAKMGVQMPANAEIALMNALVVKAEQRTGTAEAFLRELTGEDTAERIIVKKEKEDKGKWPGWLKALVIASAVLMIAAPITLVLAKQFVIADHVMDITIPNVQNMSREEAKAAIEEAGMQYMEVDSEYNVFAEKDTVLSQDPKSGTMGSSDTVVEVVISAGPEYAIVPDMTYVETEQAVAELEELGFKTVVIEENSDTAPGVICAQSIAPQESQVIGRKVIITKSLGYENATSGEDCVIPNISGMEMEEAKNLLKSEGLYIVKEEEEWNEEIEVGVILSQNIEQDTTAKTGDVIKVSVSKGKEQVIVPYVINKTSIEAFDTLESLGFDVDIQLEYSDTVEHRDVIKQNIDSNEIVYIHDDNNIIITISLGEMGKQRNTIAAGDGYVVGITEDLTCVSTGINDYGQCDVYEWRNIETISVGYSHTLAINTSGELMGTGRNDSGDLNIDGWINVIACSAGGAHTVALLSNGQLLSTGSIDRGQRDISNWIGITKISAGTNLTVGLNSEGKVIVTNHLQYIQGPKLSVIQYKKWSNIADISAGSDHTLALKLDGTVVAAGINYWGQCEVDEWDNIIAISAKGSFSVGLRADGTVIAAGFDGFEHMKQEIEEWEDIIEISVGSPIVGLKSNGTVVAVGDNDYGQCDVKGWKLRTP